MVCNPLSYYISFSGNDWKLLNSWTQFWDGQKPQMTRHLQLLLFRHLQNSTQVIINQRLLEAVCWRNHENNTILCRWYIQRAQRAVCHSALLSDGLQQLCHISLIKFVFRFRWLWQTYHPPNSTNRFVVCLSIKLAGWWFGCHQFYFPINIGNFKSSQLTSSYSSEGWRKTTNQPCIHDLPEGLLGYANLYAKFRIPKRSSNRFSCWYGLISKDWIAVYHRRNWSHGWWFGTFIIFLYIGNNHPNWLIFFRGVQTTNE